MKRVTGVTSKTRISVGGTEYSFDSSAILAINMLLERIVSADTAGITIPKGGLALFIQNGREAKQLVLYPDILRELGYTVVSMKATTKK